MEDIKPFAEFAVAFADDSVEIDGDDTRWFTKKEYEAIAEPACGSGQSSPARAFSQLRPSKLRTSTSRPCVSSRVLTLMLQDSGCERGW